MRLTEIPFNKPTLMGKELHYISEAISNGHASGDGPFTMKCQSFLEKELGIKKVLLTTSCTHALEMTALLLDLKPGDEVIVPSYTFVSTVNAYVLRGARPRFVDVRADTLNIDERLLPDAINKKTKAIIVVHYAGIGCEMESILSTASKNCIPVIEDNAHGLFGSYRNKSLGSLGLLGTLSFHETKNFSCGEGGALLLNSDAYVERAEILREKGTNRKKYMRGLVDKYTWVDIGSSYLPSDLLAAFLFAQLECRNEIMKRRRTIWEKYQFSLSNWAPSFGVRLPYIPKTCEQSYHMFYLIMPDKNNRAAFIQHLKSKGILSVFHYQPLNKSKMANLTSSSCSCPVSEMLGECLVRLPFYTSMTDSEQDSVIDAVRSFRIP